jgi:membrane-associated phospholipid phosphatase
VVAQGIRNVYLRSRFVVTKKTEIERRALGSVTISLTVGIITALILRWDLVVEQYVLGARMPVVNVAAQLLSSVGDPRFYVAFSAVAFIYFRFIQFNRIRASRALFFLLAVVGAVILTYMLKASFGRARPMLYFEYGIYGFHPFDIAWNFSSFPSEHAAVAAAIAVAFFILVPAYRVTFIILALLVATSRVVLMAHYLSDVLAGLLLGCVIVMGLKSIFDDCGSKLR